MGRAALQRGLRRPVVVGGGRRGGRTRRDPHDHAAQGRHHHGHRLQPRGAGRGSARCAGAARRDGAQPQGAGRSDAGGSPPRGGRTRGRGQPEGDPGTPAHREGTARRAGPYSCRGRGPGRCRRRHARRRPRHQPGRDRDRARGLSRGTSRTRRDARRAAGGRRHCGKRDAGPCAGSWHRPVGRPVRLRPRRRRASRVLRRRRARSGARRRRPDRLPNRAGVADQRGAACAGTVGHGVVVLRTGRAHRVDHGRRCRRPPITKRKWGARDDRHAGARRLGRCGYRVVATLPTAADLGTVR